MLACPSGNVELSTAWLGEIPMSPPGSLVAPEQQAMVPAAISVISMTCVMASTGHCR